MQCSNPVCSNAEVPGKASLMCPCRSAGYCSKECQKVHWKAGHKTECSTKAAAPGSPTKSGVVATSSSSSSSSSGSSSSSSGGLTPNDIFVRLQQAKMMTQNAVRNGDLGGAVRLANECLALATRLSEPNSSIETSTTCLRLASIYAQMGEAERALAMSDQCLDRASKWSAMVRPGADQDAAKEVLMAGNGTKSHIMLTAGKLTEAYETAAKAGAISKELFPSPSDVRHYRPIRAMAFVKDRQGKDSEAEALFLEAYKLQLAQNKPLDQEFNQSLEELISFIMRQKDGGPPKDGADDKATVYAEKHVKALETLVAGPSEGKSAEEKKREELILGDAMARLASLRFRRVPQASEELMLKTLAIRERNIGPDTQGVGITLVALSEMREVQNKLDAETERLLLRAMSIFEKLEKKGRESEHCMRIAHKIERLRALREGRMPPPDNDSLFLEDSDDSKPSGGASSSLASSAKKAASTSKGKAKRTPPTLPTFEAGDAKKRFEVAIRLLQDDYFEEAQPIAQEAFEIFKATLGEGNVLTQKAFQNAMYAAHKCLELRWIEVFEELCAEQDAKAAGKGSGITGGGFEVNFREPPREAGCAIC